MDALYIVGLLGMCTLCLSFCYVSAACATMVGTMGKDDGQITVDLP